MIFFTHLLTIVRINLNLVSTKWLQIWKKSMMKLSAHVLFMWKRSSILRQSSFERYNSNCSIIEPIRTYFIREVSTLVHHGAGINSAFVRVGPKNWVVEKLTFSGHKLTYKNFIFTGKLLVDKFKMITYEK